MIYQSLTTSSSRCLLDANIIEWFGYYIHCSSFKSYKIEVLCSLQTWTSAKKIPRFVTMASVATRLARSNVSAATDTCWPKELPLVLVSLLFLFALQCGASKQQPGFLVFLIVGALEPWGRIAEDLLGETGQPTLHFKTICVYWLGVWVKQGNCKERLLERFSIKCRKYFAFALVLFYRFLRLSKEPCTPFSTNQK